MDFMYTLTAISNEAKETVWDENRQLLDSYFTIAMVWAKRNARKGYRISFVKVPIALQREMKEKLENEKFSVSEYGKDFDGNKTGNSGFLIKW